MDLRVTGTSGPGISDVFYCTGGTDSAGQFLIHGIPAGKYGMYCSNPKKRGQWLKAANLEVQDQNLDLGRIDIKTLRTTVEVLPSRANPAVDLSSWRVSIARSGKMVGNSVGQDQPYLESGLRFDLDDTPAGSYQVVTSSDHALINYAVPFTINSPGESITLHATIPTGSASIFGSVTPTNIFVRLWNDDGTVEATLFPREGFQIPGLPAGTYHLGINACPGFPPLQIQSFQLAETQSKTQDLDLSQWSPHHTVLIVSAADVGGPLLFASQCQLKGAQGIIQGQANSSSRSIFLVPSGDYELTVQCDGYHDHTESIHLAAPEQQDPWGEKTVKVVLLTPSRTR